MTDTHPLLFHAAGGRRLGKKAARAFAAAEHQHCVLYVPVAVIWECALLARAGRVDLRRSVREFFGDLFSNAAYQPVDLTPEQTYMAGEARPNDDPFDALICAAARQLELPLISRDVGIEGSGLVQTVWQTQCGAGDRCQVGESSEPWHLNPEGFLTDTSPRLIADCV